MMFKQGDFVRLREKVSKPNAWVEIVDLINSFRQDAGIAYMARFWNKTKGDWQLFTLCPDTYHKDMIAESITLTKEVADIFRENLKHDV